MMKHNPYNLKKGDKVGLDKDLAHSSEVYLQKMTTLALYSFVSNEKESPEKEWWQVMTYRLIPITK